MLITKSSPIQLQHTAEERIIDLQIIISILIVFISTPLMYAS